MIEINTELITGIIGILGAIIVIIFRLLNIPLSSLNVFKRSETVQIPSRKEEILKLVENVIDHDSLKFVSKYGRVLKFSNIVKPSQNDFMSDYLKALVSLTRKTNVSYKKLTLDCSEVNYFNSTFLAALSSVILDVKKNNDCKLLVVFHNKSKLADLINNFEMLKEDSSSIEFKILKDAY